MRYISEYYIWISFGLCAIGFGISCLWFIHKKKKYPTATETDHLFWKMEIATVCAGCLIFLFGGIIPFTPYTPEIYPTDTQEQKIERLIENDKEMREYVRSFRDLSYISFYTTGLYLVIMAGFYKNYRKKRDLESLRENREYNRPLDL